MEYVQDTSDNTQLEPQRRSLDRRALADDDHRPVKKPRIVNDEVKNKEQTEIKNQKVSIFIV